MKTRGSILTPEEEESFQEWYREISTKKQIDPNPDNPRHNYDYRGFYKSEKSGESSMGYDVESGEFHFPSEFKKPGHPTYYKKFQR